jgi:hypothetical protein
MTKKLVMVEVLSQYRMRYVIEVEDDIDHALDEVIMQEQNAEFHEFSQKHLEPSPIIAHYEISRDEYLKIFNEDNDYLAKWDDDKKFSYINYIDYDSQEMEIDDGA